MAVTIQALTMLVCAYCMARLFQETGPSAGARKAVSYIGIALVFASCSLGVLGGNGATP